MSAIEQIPVYGLNQDAGLDAPLKLVSREEARAMKRENAGWFISSGKAFRLAERIPEIAQTISICALGSLDITAATITLQETRANVGLVDDRVRNPREAVRRAQAKVRLYPHILDVLAPLARGSWLNPECLTVTAQAR
jgi:hypothetical protein